MGLKGVAFTRIVQFYSAFWWSVNLNLKLTSNANAVLKTEEFILSDERATQYYALYLHFIGNRGVYSFLFIIPCSCSK